MAGRPPKMPGTHQRHMTREEQAIQEDNKKKLETFTPLQFDKVPHELSRSERKEWLRLAEDLKGLPLTELDRNLLISYCSWWNIFLQAKRDVAENGLVVKGTSKKNPSVDTMRAANQEIKSISSDLGLNLKSRLDLINTQNTSDEEDGDDPFDL